MYKVTSEDIRLLKEKDEETFDKIWKAYANILVMFILNYYDNISEEDAKDIAEHTLIKGTYCNISMFDENKSSFTTWLFSIARNLSIDFIRKNKINDELNEADYYVENNKIKVNKILDDVKCNLDKSEFDIIVVHKFYGLSVSEISTSTKLSKSKIKFILSKAYKKIIKIKEKVYE